MKKQKMTNQEYKDALKRFEEIRTPEDARKFHKEQRKYKNGIKLPLFRRYPDFPMQISIVALVIAILELAYVALTIIF